ncbi:L10-interacting MYB domain-containing protein-like [Senna tora]|uniref:L10-interacting MYB domain-containing protein-like n=1 Tax=Senna tora TaxID=362788 RepID=A0A834TKE7_9FABA|nr:L10-interacting MYB domain-containing protein-like [Senna tora]
MVEEVNKGNMTNGVFTPKVTDTTSRLFSATTTTGFGWNAETNTVTADEEVWSRYILAHSDVVQYKKNGLEHYNLLGIIFKRSTATGVLHHSSTQAPLDSQQERELEMNNLWWNSCRL